MKKPLNQVLAENLHHFMALRPDSNTQPKLAKRSGVSQRTIGNYLRPELRAPTNTGKAPSAKLSEIELLAKALEVDAWELLRPMSAEDRVIYRKIEEAFSEIRRMRPDPTSDTVPANVLHEPRKRWVA